MYTPSAAPPTLVPKMWPVDARVGEIHRGLPNTSKCGPHWHSSHKYILICVPQSLPLTPRLQIVYLVFMTESALGLNLVCWCGTDKVHHRQSLERSYLDQFSVLALRHVCFLGYSSPHG
jgi:hypothetical protein